LPVQPLAVPVRVGTRGYVALANNDIGYDMQRDLGTDHPLYA
jgi:hypothetical protein